MTIHSMPSTAAFRENWDRMHPPSRAAALEREMAGHFILAGGRLPQMVCRWRAQGYDCPRCGPAALLPGQVRQPAPIPLSLAPADPADDPDAGE